MECFDIAQGQGVLIYGAGTNGREMERLLKKSERFAVAFIDRKAAEMGCCNGIKTLTLAAAAKEYGEQNIPVVIAVADFFLHESIAQELFKAGFNRILYKAELITQKRSSYAARLNAAYDELMAAQRRAVSDIPMYMESDPCRWFNPIIECQHLGITAYVPACLLTADIGNNGSLLGKTLYTELFEMLDRGNLWNIDSYKAYVRSCKPDVSENELNRIVAGREQIWHRFNDAIEFSTDFFKKSPVCVAYEKNRFEIRDGRHRACFLIQKGFEYIPCHMTQEDFERWENASAAKDYSAFLEEREFELNIPINNPRFFTPGKRKVSVVWKALCRYFAEADIIIQGKPVAIVGDVSGYYARCLFRMGALVCCTTDDERATRIINNLERCGVMNECLGWEHVGSIQKIDFAFFPEDSFMHEQRKDVMNVAEKVSHIFIETSRTALADIQSVLGIREAAKWNIVVIRRVLKDGGIREIAACVRK